MDQGSNKNHSPAYNCTPTVTKFCVMWEGLSLPHDTKFGNCRCKIVDSRSFHSWSLIHGLRWSGLIKVGPGRQFAGGNVFKMSGKEADILKTTFPHLVQAWNCWCEGYRSSGGYDIAIIVNHTRKEKNYTMSTDFFQQNASESGVCKMSAMLFRFQCIKYKSIFSMLIFWPWGICYVLV